SAPVVWAKCIARDFINIAADLKPEEVAMRPAAEALLKKRLASQGKDLPSSFCKPTGVPILNSVPVPFKIIQSPRLIVILYEENNVFRQIFLDGRRPIKDAEPRFMGYSSNVFHHKDTKAQRLQSATCQDVNRECGRNQR